MITKNEMRAALLNIADWPHARLRELAEMEQNEREWFLLAAAYLQAVPESEEPPEGGSR